MRNLAGILLALWWAVWLYSPLFRAPLFQKRPSITVAGPTRAGLLLECIAILVALWFREPAIEPWRIAAAAVFGTLAVVLFWTSVTHLGKQFRIHAGLYDDHELVQTGPYGIVRHPIYCSLLCMLLCTIFSVTRWEWALPAIAIYIAGTEIRVHSEEKLLRSRFGEAFDRYRQRVPAYIPFVR